MKYSDTSETPFELAEADPDGTLRQSATGQAQKSRRLRVSMPDANTGAHRARLPDRLLLYAEEFKRADKTCLVKDDLISITWISAAPAFLIAAFDCLAALSACWGIACYSWDDGAWPLLKRLDPQPGPSC